MSRDSTGISPSREDRASCAAALRSAMKFSILQVWSLLFIITAESLERKKSSRTRVGLIVRPRLITHCDEPNNAMYIKSMSLVQSGAFYLINNNFTLLRGCKSLSQVVVEVTKCKDAVSFNTCEYFQTWRFTESLCNLIFNPRTFFASYIGRISPTFDCPLKKGDYQTINGTIDVSLLEVVPVRLEGNVWKTKVRIHDEHKDMFSCMLVNVEFVRTRIET